MDTVDDIRSRIKDRKKTVIIISAVVLLALLATGGIYMYGKDRTKKADSLRSDAYQAFSVTLMQPAAASADNYKKARSLFRESYDVKARADVLLFIAYCNYGLGDYDEAIKDLTELTSKYRDSAVLPLAYYKLSEAYLKKNDQAAALAALGSIEALNAGYMDMAVMQAARILDLQGKTAEAKARYNELVTKYPDSAYAKEAKTRAAQK
jgi:predicted negative regulator of RcsB-dependent stress response